MKKLQQLQPTGTWRYVFCYTPATGCVVLTDDRSKALPTEACWGAADLAFFRLHFPANYRLH